MPNKTFDDLNEEKKTRIENALLKEFSNYPLAEAQVARIIVEASISRGSFYKYFDDIQDSYQYLINKVIGDIHRQLPDISDGDSSKYIVWIEDFIKHSDKSGYMGVISKHFRYNEGTLGHSANPKPTNSTKTSDWADFIIFHQVFMDVVLDPDSMKSRLSMLKKYLKERK